MAKNKSSWQHWFLWFVTYPFRFFAQNQAPVPKSATQIIHANTTNVMTVALALVDGGVTTIVVVVVDVVDVLLGVDFVVCVVDFVVFVEDDEDVEVDGVV